MTIELRRDDDVFVLHLRRRQNRIDLEFVEGFERALDEVETCEDPVALVTTGEDRFYSTGLDLEWLRGDGRKHAGPFLDRLHGLWGRMLGFPTITVAALNGHAFAGGAMTALAHDFRVMRSDDVHFCLPEVDLATGGPLTPGMYALIGARLAPPVFHEALVTGKRYSGEEAAERGMVNEAVAAAEVLPRAVEIARSLAGKHRGTVAALKRGLFASAIGILEGS